MVFDTGYCDDYTKCTTPAGAVLPYTPEFCTGSGSGERVTQFDHNRQIRFWCSESHNWLLRDVQCSRRSRHGHLCRRAIIAAGAADIIGRAR